MKTILPGFSKVFQKSQKKSPVILFLFFFFFLSLMIFFLTKESTPSTFEITYNEYSPNGESAGSVIPASCNSASPMAQYWRDGSIWRNSGSHFRGDCQTKCNQHRSWMYDPYFDRNRESCPTTGNFESVNATTCKVNGWAFDSSRSSTSIRVHVYRDGRAGTGTAVISCPTNILREGVNSAWNITGKHGFSCTLPASYVNSGGHNLYIHAIDISGSPNNLIDNSPKWLDCVDPVCTGDVPDGATMYNNDDDGLVADLAYQYSATNTGRKCQFKCDDNSVWNGSICRDPMCTGTIPNRAILHSNTERTGLAADVAYTYSATNTAPKCQFKCNTGYVWESPACVPAICTGTVPANATAYPSDRGGLVAHVAYTYSATNTAPKCQFRCNTGYVWDAGNSRCVYRLKICKNSCGSNAERTIPPMGASGFLMDSGTTVDLKTCYNSATDCSLNLGDVTSSTTWTDLNNPADAITFPSDGRVSANRFAGGGTRTERFTAVYNGITARSAATVTCIRNTCDIPAAVRVTDTYCPEITQDTRVSDGCNGTLTCPGTRNCNYNIKEVAP